MSTYLRQAEQIMATADLENRLLTAAEAERFDRLMALHEAGGGGSARMASAGAPGGAGNWGWNGFAEFCAAVKVASNPDGGAGVEKARTRLLNAPTTYGQEGVGADGGFAVPPDFRTEIMRKVFAEDQLLQRTDQIPTASSGVTLPKDEAAPWSSTGIQAYWEGEANQLQQRKPALENSTIKAHKLTALVPVTDELLEDAPAMGAYVLRKGPEVMNTRINDAIVRGTGAGMPLGILNSGCLVSVAKETSQAAATLLGANVIKMFSRLYAGWMADSVWLVNNDVLPQLLQLNIPIKNVAGTENVGGQPIYVPAGGLRDQPFDTLLGRPVLPIQSCSTLGTVGDIIFASLKQYGAVVRASGIRADSSIHLFFDYGVTAFRFTFRMGGQPWWSAPLSPKNGSTTIGPFVVLETRS